MTFRSCFALIMLVVAARLLPHPANFTPVFAVSWLLASRATNRLAHVSLLLSLFISDGVLFYLFGGGGDWLLGVYSAYALIMFAMQFLALRNSGYWVGLLITTVASSFFWLWTNGFVFITGQYYPHTFSGLLSCYGLALPFLAWSLLGNALWSAILTMPQAMRSPPPPSILGISE